LEGGPPSFAPGFSFRALLRNTATTPSCVRLPGSHRLWPSVPGEFASRAVPRPQVLQPRCHKDTGLGLDPFRSPLLRTSRLISLPPGTEMFQFPGFASLLPVMTGCNTRRVAPFGHLRITACVPLPGASRSLPRPSSPLCAQASPTCLLSLDYKNVQAEIRALLSQSTSTAFVDLTVACATAFGKPGKDSISHEYAADPKTSGRRPILCLSLFKQRHRDDNALAVEPRIVLGRCGRCKCRHPARVPRPRVTIDGSRRV
jgi:hypothetical protein